MLLSAEVTSGDEVWVLIDSEVSWMGEVVRSFGAGWGEGGGGECYSLKH